MHSGRGRDGGVNALPQRMVPGATHVLDNRPYPFPLLLSAQTTLAQDNQTRMDRHIEEFDEVLRVRRDNRKVMIERILPNNTVRSTPKTDVRHRLRIDINLTQ